MSLNLFSDIGDESFWSLAELRSHLKVAESAYMREAREVDYFGQRVVYASKTEILLVIKSLRKEISRRVTGKTGKTKKIVMTTISKGF